MFENAVSTRGTRVINVTSPMCRFIRSLLYIVCTNGTFPVVSSALVSQYLAYWWIPFLSFFLSRAKILNPLSLRSEKIQTEIHKTIIIHTDWIIIHFNILKKRKKNYTNSSARPIHLSIIFFCLFLSCSPSFNRVKYLENNKTPYFTETPIVEAANANFKRDLFPTRDRKCEQICHWRF